MVKKEIHEIGRMGRSKKQNEKVVKSRMIEEGIGNIERTRGIWMTESQNVETDGKILRFVDVARGMSAEGAARSKKVECHRKQRR
jgi:hypothetical protein